MRVSILPSTTSSAKSGDWLAKLTIGHAAIQVMLAAWLFGGKIYWAELPLRLWASLAIVLTFAGFARRRNQHGRVLRLFLWLLPAVLLCTLVLISSFNPSFIFIRLYDAWVYRPVVPISWLPSSAKPFETRYELWLLACLYLTGYNLALNVSSLRLLQRLAMTLAINTTVIALFGSLQKLSGQQMFFGLQKAPNSSFFGCFIYHNHWGPFALMGLAMWLGLVPRLSQNNGGRGFWHSPAVGALLAGLLIAAAIPLSTSRSSTLLLTILITGAVMHHALRFRRHARRLNQSSTGPILGIASLALLAAVAVYFVAGDVIQKRINKTKEQVAVAREEGSLGERPIIYGETIDIWRAKPWMGWGLETWELLFRRTTRLTNHGDSIQIYYEQAHSDWLQSLAETGAVGTLLLLAMAGGPLWSVRRVLLGSSLSGYMIGANALIALYAWIEFPLANPAVVAMFWVSFFCAIRHAQISAST